MQDYQIGPKIVVLAPAEKAWLPLSIITKMVENNLVCQLGLHLPTYLLDSLYEGNRPIVILSFSF
jgi:hypothetical protein